MSLIIEALKRARDDAVRRQAASRGLPLAPVPRLNGRSRWLTLALIPLAGALVICLLLLFDLYSQRPRTAPLTATTPAETQVNAANLQQAPPLQSAGNTQVHDLEVQPSSADTMSTPSRSAATAASNSPPSTVGSQASSLSSPPIAGSADSMDALEQTPAEPVSIRVDSTARELVGQAKLRDGQLVDLEGIAWSESEPFALLNGQVVGVGEFIRGYRVSEIMQDQVVLEQGDDRVVLRLK